MELVEQMATAVAAIARSDDLLNKSR